MWKFDLFVPSSGVREHPGTFFFRFIMNHYKNHNCMESSLCHLNTLDLQVNEDVLRLTIEGKFSHSKLWKQFIILLWPMA